MQGPSACRATVGVDIDSMKTGVNDGVNVEEAKRIPQPLSTYKETSTLRGRDQCQRPDDGTPAAVNVQGDFNVVRTGPTSTSIRHSSPTSTPRRRQRQKQERVGTEALGSVHKPTPSFDKPTPRRHARGI